MYLPGRNDYPYSVVNDILGGPNTIVVNRRGRREK